MTVFSDLAQVMQNARADAHTLDEFLHNPADTQVTSRLGKRYWTLATLDNKLSLVKIRAENTLADLDTVGKSAKAAIDAKLANVTDYAQDINNKINNNLTNVKNTAAAVTNDINNQAQALNAKVDSKLQQVDAAINTAAAAGAGAKGWNDLLIQTQTGRSQADKNKDMLSVKDFGVTGDGTTDDTDKLKEAISKGATYFPAGSYVITDYKLILATASFAAEGDKAKLIYKGQPVQLGNISAFQKIAVPELLPSIALATEYVNVKSFIDKGFVSISIAPGENDDVHGTDDKPLQQVLVKVADGHKRVEYTGRTDNRFNTVLRFDSTGNKSAFMCQWGDGIYKIANMLILGVGGFIKYGEWNDQSYGSGILAEANSTVAFIENVAVQRFYYSFHARNGSSITCLPGCESKEAGDVGFFAYGNASMVANGCFASYASHASAGLGGGFCAEMNSQIRCEECVADHHNTHGFTATTNSSMWCQASHAEWNNRNGFYTANSMMVAEYGIKPGTHCIANDNGENGFEAYGGGFLACNSAVARYNGKNGFRTSGGGIVEITATESHNNRGEGYHAIYGGVMLGNDSNAHHNSLCGFYAGRGASITSDNAISTNNAQFGALAEKAGFIELSNYQANNNGKGNRLPATNVENNLGGYLLA